MPIKPKRGRACTTGGRLRLLRQDAKCGLTRKWTVGLAELRQGGFPSPRKVERAHAAVRLDEGGTCRRSPVRPRFYGSTPTIRLSPTLPLYICMPASETRGITLAPSL